MIGAIIAKRKARSVFDSLSRHDLDTFLADWAEDATFLYIGHTEKVSGQVEGKEAIGEWFQMLMEEFPLTSFTVKNTFVRDAFAFSLTNAIAIEWDSKVQHKGGETSENSGITVVHLKKGKVVLMREYIVNPLSLIHRTVGDALLKIRKA